MIELIGKVIELYNKGYLVIRDKKIDNRVFVLTAAVTHPYELNVLEVREGDNGKIQAQLYQAESLQEVFKEELQRSMTEILEQFYQKELQRPIPEDIKRSFQKMDEIVRRRYRGTLTS
jgi:predicted transglutaminase-like protease